LVMRKKIARAQRFALGCVGAEGVDQ